MPAVAFIATFARWRRQALAANLAERGPGLAMHYVKVVIVVGIDALARQGQHPHAAYRTVAFPEETHLAPSLGAPADLPAASQCAAVISYSSVGTGSPSSWYPSGLSAR